MNRKLSIHTPHGSLYGELTRPEGPRGLIVLARARHAPADAAMAATLVNFGFATLTMELLTAQEAQFADATHNVPRLTQRLIDLLEFIQRDGDIENLPLAILASGDTTPAAIRASARRDKQISALVCHGGQIDRAGREALEYLKAPLLILFDAADPLGESAFQRAASHLNTLHVEQTLQAAEDPATHAASWLLDYLKGEQKPPSEAIMDFQ